MSVIGLRIPYPYEYDILKWTCYIFDVIEITFNGYNLNGYINWNDDTKVTRNGDEKVTRNGDIDS